MNVAMPFYNIFKDLNFKPGDNCASPLGQTLWGQTRINFTAMVT
jgi:hypothetical protein